MGKIIVMFLAGVACMSAASCGMVRSVVFTPSQVESIRRGMTKEEVLAITKTAPDYKRFSKDREQWEFHRYVNSNNTAIIIDFHRGIVDELNTLPLPPKPSGRDW